MKWECTQLDDLDAESPLNGSLRKPAMQRELPFKILGLLTAIAPLRVLNESERRHSINWN